MKLSIERTPAFYKLATYFKKIEDIADHMGIEVDDLVQDNKKTPGTMYTTFKKRILSRANHRVRLLKEYNEQDSSANGTSIVGLNVLVNQKDQR